MLSALSVFEEILWYVTIPLVALFAHPNYTYEFSTPKYAFLAISVVVIGLFLFIRLIKTKTLNFFATPIHWAWLAFSVIALLSTVNTYRDNPFYFRQAIDIGLYLFVNVLISFYLSSTITKKEQIVRFLFVFVLTGLVISINAILNFYIGYDLFLGKLGEPFNRVNIKANIGNVIFVANYLNMILPIVLYFVISFDVGIVESKKFWNIVFFKITSFVTALLSFAVIVFSQTRSEYIALVIEGILFGAFYFIYLRKKEDTIAKELREKSPAFYKRLSLFRMASLLVFAVLIVLIFIAYTIPTPLNRYGAVKTFERFEATDFVSSKDVRLLSWLSNLYIWKNHKLLGQGIGTYQVYGLYGIADLISEKPEYSYAWSNFKRAHNDYLQVLSETGLLGFACIIAMAILLVVYVFKNISKIEEKDDLILFSMLVLSGIVFSIQSFFSFPGHLLPNALLANFVISVGLGKYFNKSFGKEFKVKGNAVVILGAIFLIAASLSMYLRWNHFISELYFKDGNIAFSNLTYLRQESWKIDNYLNQLDALENDLNNFTGQFETLDPTKWHNVKETQAKQSGVTYNKLMSENERQRTIATYKSQLANQKSYLLNQKRNLPSMIEEQYNLAKTKFLKSVRLNHTYGKSHFYLAALATEPLRIKELSDLLAKDPKNVLSQNGDEFQKVIPEKYKYKFYELLSDIVEKDLEFAAKANLASIQGFIDSISLYELSLSTFTERNTFKALAMRYYSLYQINNYLINQIKNPEIEKKIQAYSALFFNRFGTWARRTVDILPGAWNRFTDWKNYDIEKATNGEDIYRFFANATVGILDPVNIESREILVDLALKEIKTSQFMEIKNTWGVPDGILDHLHGLAVEYQKIAEYQESVYTYEQILTWYRDIYNMLKIKVENTEWLKKSFDSFIEKFNKEFDAILAKEDKGYLSNTFTPLVMNNLKSSFDKFISIDFKNVENEFLSELIRLTPNLWPNLKKVSVWKTIANKAVEYPRTHVQHLNMTNESIKEINDLLDSFVDLQQMHIYERYARFVNRYELIKEEAIKLIENLLKKYENESEELILRDWSEIIFNSPKIESKEEIIKFLKDTIQKYKESTN